MDEVEGDDGGLDYEGGGEDGDYCDEAGYVAGGVVFYFCGFLVSFSLAYAIKSCSMGM